MPNYFLERLFHFILLLSSVQSLSHVWLFATLKTVGYQASVSMGFPRQEYWSGAISFSKGSSWPRDRTWLSCIAGRFLTISATREALSSLSVQFSSFHFSCSVISNSLPPHEPQHTRPPCPSPSLRVYPNSYPLSRWCHPTISSSVFPFSSCPQSLPVSEPFPTSQLFAWGGQSIGVSASASVLPMNTQDWSPLGWTGWISLQSKGLSRVLSNTTVQKHQFFSAQLSSQSNSHIHTWPLEKPKPWLDRPLLAK